MLKRPSLGPLGPCHTWGISMLLLLSEDFSYLTYLPPSALYLLVLALFIVAAVLHPVYRHIEAYVIII